MGDSGRMRHCHGGCGAARSPSRVRGACESHQRPGGGRGYRLGQGRWLREGGETGVHGVKPRVQPEECVRRQLCGSRSAARRTLRERLRSLSAARRRVVEDWVVALRQAASREPGSAEKRAPAALCGRAAGLSAAERLPQQPPPPRCAPAERRRKREAAPPALLAVARGCLLRSLCPRSLCQHPRAPAAPPAAWLREKGRWATLDGRASVRSARHAGALKREGETDNAMPKLKRRALKV